MEEVKKGGKQSVDAAKALVIRKSKKITATPAKTSPFKTAATSTKASTKRTGKPLKHFPKPYQQSRSIGEGRRNARKIIPSENSDYEADTEGSSKAKERENRSRRSRL